MSSSFPLTPNFLRLGRCSSSSSMIRKSQKEASRTSLSLHRWFHASSCRTALKQKLLPATTPANVRSRVAEQPKVVEIDKIREKVEHAKRNALGVQLLSRRLHSQLFPDTDHSKPFPSPPATFTRIAHDHLISHGLDPAQGSLLPSTSFTLPPLQGTNLAEHFHRIGMESAQPYLGLAKSFAEAELPPKPEEWVIQPGWTKYTYVPGGASYWECVDDLNGEDCICFDVETMPAYGDDAIMATAASPTAWYAWLSPWLLSHSPEYRAQFDLPPPTDTPAERHLIPLGSPAEARVVIGHNISYDRARLLSEYSLPPTQTRFIDTMALHIAVKGISSPQRPAWMKNRKMREGERERAREAVGAVEGVLEMLREAEGALEGVEGKEGEREEMRRMRAGMEESLPQLQAAADTLAPDYTTTSSDEDGENDTVGGTPSQRWEDLTSANSLAEVASLHCSIPLSKAPRSAFMTLPPASIASPSALPSYLTYCATDVSTTHAVYNKVLPAFLGRCPHPVSFAGMLSMGSSFLCVDEGWEGYLEKAEGRFRALEGAVKGRLRELGEKARGFDGPEGDPWLGQLDWEMKAAGKSRGVGVDIESASSEMTPLEQPTTEIRETIPSWYNALLTTGPLLATTINRILPLLLKLSYDGHPLTYDKSLGWHFNPTTTNTPTRLPSAKSKVISVLSATHGVPVLESGLMTAGVSGGREVALRIAQGERGAELEELVNEIAKGVVSEGVHNAGPWSSQLDWSQVQSAMDPTAKPSRTTKKSKPTPAPKVYWPKWYWDLAKPKKDMPAGSIDITVRNRIAPLLLRLSWFGWPLFHSREHGWTFRVPNSAEFTTRLPAVEFHDPADDKLRDLQLRDGFIFYKLPHKDGEKANVGSPLAKTFIKYAQDGTLTSPGDEAREALDMNAQCSYWISARDRILKQNVVWQDPSSAIDMGFRDERPGKKWGVIIPQMITMGTVTRRAIEKTWLTASNAKKNRVGSELKAMVRAPPGYAIVGADVDSEELWISSCMGDAQFGMHGATAIGWMTLEGTKAAGTDLHSKTAGILGISRDQAKVFNYSRIYGAGMRHAVLLLLQSNAGMLPEEAQKLAENLYASTKGKSTHRTDMFGRKFWFGGTESFVFNKLEEIALSDRPMTPALGCGITDALSKQFLTAGFGTDYMTSRINWVVQSSGVDYLHLLIVSMDHLIKKYDIKARFLISVHDELRYLVKEEDKYRVSLALQVANLWTRCLFAYKLGMDDLPQGVAFFSAVDVDRVLRKEVDMPCVTPSQPDPIPPGESLNITQILEHTNGGSLFADGRVMADRSRELAGSLEDYEEPDCLIHRAKGAGFLRAQATSDFAEVRHLAQKESGEKFEGGIGGPKRYAKKRSNIPKSLAQVEGVDWDLVNEVLKSTKLPTTQPP